MSIAISPNSIPSPHSTVVMDKLTNRSSSSSSTCSNDGGNGGNSVDQQTALLGALAVASVSGSAVLQQQQQQQQPQQPKPRLSPGSIMTYLQEHNGTLDSGDNNNDHSLDSTEPNTPNSGSFSLSGNRSTVRSRSNSNRSTTPEPNRYNTVHRQPLATSSVINYNIDNSTQPDFVVTLSTEEDITFNVHSIMLKKSSEFFLGVLEDEPDRTSIELHLSDSDFTSGDIQLWLDVVYSKSTISSLNNDDLIMVSLCASYFDCTSLLSQCEQQLTNTMSPSSLKRTIRGRHNTSDNNKPINKQASSRSVVSDGLNTTELDNNSTLSNLALADRLHMDELKQACINELTTNGFGSDKEEITETLQKLSHETLEEVLTAVIEKKF